jgi:2-dehydro-3-deoxyphosphogluconate aldolase/(4S)-4-hydroxy-2-oxoglutarate aldolase
VRRLIESAAVALIRVPDRSSVLPIVEAIAEGGIGAIEITLTVPGALEEIERVAARMGDRILLGVGSVLYARDAQRALDAGARYVISPVYKRELIDVAHAAGVPALPGCYSPTEIQTAHEAGADIVKVFPANALGQSFIRGVLAPMPHLKLMPTGGVSLTNAGDWLRAGACVVGVGSALLEADAISDARYGVLTGHARTLRKSIDEARSATST